MQYQFSTALLEENNTDFSSAKTLSFAPFANQSFGDRFSRLPGSGQEILKTDGRHFIDSAATKENFLQNSSQFRIMHLATHAVANNGTQGLSYISFFPKGKNSENLLYTEEIYNLRLAKTGLVILSACETGTGQLVKGEGVLSLSRAFSYAGCPNIITSLWKADDFSTAYITTRIHRYLQEGYPISKAVQKAKVDYLKDKNINPRMKQPYYWSHLVFIGNYEPEKVNHWTWVLLSTVLVAIISFILWRKKPGRARR